MRSAIARNLRAGRAVVALLRARGYGAFEAHLHAPLIAMGRVYRRGASFGNGLALVQFFNGRRIVKAVRTKVDPARPQFCVIVMPGTLHFLLPCLQRFPPHVHVTLIGNGARSWELAKLSQRFPHFGLARLLTLPRSSVPHGHVLTLLLRAHESDFGVLDHDFFVFDPSLFENLTPASSECLTAALAGISDRGLPYPHTCFLYFNTAVIRPLMLRYGIDARSYRRVPGNLESALASIPRFDGSPLKRYHSFLDTLHLLLLVAISEGYEVRWHPNATEAAAVHIGGTSSGAPATKSLVSAYTEWRLLELVNDTELTARYAPRLGKFASSNAVRGAIPLTPENFALLDMTDRFIDRLQHY